MCIPSDWAEQQLTTNSNAVDTINDDDDDDDDDTQGSDGDGT